MISALAEAGAFLPCRDYLDAAVACAEFVQRDLRDERGGCCAPTRMARRGVGAYLEDHAYLVEALLTLYEATFDTRWFDAARETADQMIERFGDSERGGFFTTAEDGEKLIARRKDLDDHPIPSGNLGGGLRAASPGGAHRRARVRSATRSESCGCCIGRPRASPRRSPISSRRSRSTSLRSARSRSRAGGRRRGRGARRPRRRWFARPTGRTWCSPEAPRNRPARADARAARRRRPPAAYVCENFTCRAPVTDRRIWPPR